VAEKVGPVGRHVDGEAYVGDGQHVEQRRAGRRVGVQLEDAVGVRAQADLDRRAEHPLGVLAADLAPLERDAVGQRDADAGERVLLPRCHVGSAAHHAQRRAARVHLAQREAVRVGMPGDIENFADHHVRETGMQRLHRVHRGAQHVQPVAHLGGLEARAEEVGEPAERGVHRPSTNCAWSRTSAS
jgi:hypothetical protein